MAVVRVESTIHAAPERVFQVLTDHEGYGKLPGLNAFLIEEGSPDRNGVGAVRSLGGGPVAMHERITLFEPPTAYEYLIIGGTLPMDHRGGRVEVQPVDGGAHVVWTTELGGFMGALSGPGVKLVLKRLLAFVKTEAERTP